MFTDLQLNVLIRVYEIQQIWFDEGTRDQVLLMEWRGIGDGYQEA